MLTIATKYFNSKFEGTLQKSAKGYNYYDMEMTNFYYYHIRTSPYVTDITPLPIL